MQSVVFMDNASATVIVMQLLLVQDLISRPPGIEGKWNGCCPGPLKNYVGAICSQWYNKAKLGSLFINIYYTEKPEIL